MDSQEYIASGVLEDYLLGLLTAEECREVEHRLATTPEVRAAFQELEEGLEAMAFASQMRAPAGLKASVMDALDALQEAASTPDPARPPVISASSTPADFAFWIDQPQMVPPASYDNIFFIPFSQNEMGMSAIVWMKDGSPEEVHTDEIEKFLILEGSCDIRIGDTIHQLQAGDTLSIPLHIPHEVTVTSDIPCKILLQRIAA